MEIWAVALLLGSGEHWHPLPQAFPGLWPAQVLALRQMQIQAPLPGSREHWQVPSQAFPGWWLAQVLVLRQVEMRRRVPLLGFEKH